MSARSRLAPARTAAWLTCASLAVACSGSAPEKARGGAPEERATEPAVAPPSPAPKPPGAPPATSAEPTPGSTATASTPAAQPAASALVPVALPAPRHGHRIEQVGGGLLCFGGFGDASVPDRETRQTWWLAPGATAWQRRADMQLGRAFFASAVARGSAYAVGDGVERYDQGADRWTVVVPAGSLPSSHFAAAAVGTTLYVLGGFHGARDVLQAVDLDTGDIRESPPPPSFGRGDHFHCLHALGGKLHVIGGLDAETFLPRAEHWVLGEQGWEAAVPPPVGVWAKFAAQAIADGKLYLFGEFGAFRFDPATSAWEPRAKLATMMALPQAVALDGAIWVVGGMPVEGERGPILLRYDLARDAW